MFNPERRPPRNLETPNTTVEILEHTSPNGHPCRGTTGSIYNIGTPLRPKFSLACDTCHRQGVIPSKPLS